MILHKVYIENFGKLHKYEMSFEQPLTTIKQDNGWGKTTLAMFIKVMFYGFSSYNKSDLNQNERKKFLPWNGQKCGGYLVFEHGGNTYRITRSFGSVPSKDEFLLTNEISGVESADFDESVGHKLFGVSADGFERSVFVTNGGLGNFDRQSIMEKLTNLLQDTQNDSDFSVIENKFNENIKRIKNAKNAGELPTAEQEVLALKQKIQNTAQQKLKLDENYENFNNLEVLIKQTEQKLSDIRKQKNEVAQVQKTLFVQDMHAKHKAQVKESETALQLASNSFLHVPQQNEIDFAQNSGKKLNELQKDKANLTPSDGGQAEQNLEKMFSSGVPTQPEFEKMFSHLGSSSNVRHKKPKERLSAILFALAVIGEVAAALLFTTNLVVAFAALVLGLVLGFAGIFVYLKNYMSTNLKTITQPSGDGAATVQEFLLKYYNKNEYDSPLTALTNLQKNAIVYSQMQIEKENRTKKLQEIENEENVIIAEMNKLNNKFFGQNELTVSEFLAQLGQAWDNYLVAKRDQEQKVNILNNFVAEHGSEINKTVNAKTPLSSIELQEAQYSQEFKEMLEARSKLELEIQKLNEIVDQLPALENELQTKNDFVEQLQKRKALLETTLNFLKRARDNINIKYLLPMQKAFNSRERELALSVLGKLTINANLQLNIESEGNIWQIDYYSQGYKDLLEFTLRIALIDVIFEKEKPVILLDDPFVNLDDGKQKLVKNLLQQIAKEYQIIYMTCHESRVI